jgi:ABC-type glycerol-3-phosphate transport system substrate-binding protein
MQSEHSALEALIAQTRLRPVSRLSFMRRAIALGLSGTAIAGLLEQIEGPIPAGAAATAAQITFSSWGSLDEQATITQVLKAFSTRYPAIQVQPLLTSWASYWPKYNADLAAKSTADVQFLTYVPTYAAAGALMEIRLLLRKHSRTVPAGYTPALLSAFQYNGGLYGLPRDNDTKVIYYNRKLLRQAGVPFPTSTWSWNDLRAMARKLTVRQGNRVRQYGFAFETGWWRLYIWENGGELFDNNGRPTRVTMDSPAAVHAVQFMGDLINKDKVTPPASQIVDSTYIGPMFAGGQLALAFGNHALIPTFVKTAGLDWGVVGMPHFPGHKTINNAGGAGYCISRWTKAPEAAYQLWSFLTGPVGSLMFAAGNDIVPDNPQTLRSQVWLSKPYNKVFSQQTELGHAGPTFAKWQDVLTATTAVLDKVWIGEMSAAAALPRATATARKILKI